MDEWLEVWAGCGRVALGTHPRERSAKHLLARLAERAPDVLGTERYFTGELLERLESRVAELLGKPAAIWMPSGTMAQQIALRIHADRSGRRGVAFHPYCHLDTHEERGYELLHGLHAVHLGERHRVPSADDVAGLRERVAAVLLELPQRDLGGVLPPWEDLLAQAEASRAQGAALHLDGARLWQCGPFYGTPLAEIAGLFDTVYVSFYKDLGAPGGCALAGPEDVIAEARVWQVRHGGRVFNTYPYLLAAELGLDEVLPRIPAAVEHGRALCEELAQIDGVTVVPDPPHAAMFHALVRAPLAPLNDAVLAVARETGVWPGPRFSETEDPGVQRAEVSVSVAALEVEVDEAAELWRAFTARATT